VTRSPTIGGFLLVVSVWVWVGVSVGSMGVFFCRTRASGRFSWGDQVVFIIVGRTSRIIA
jgi:hypothetical protein